MDATDLAEKETPAPQGTGASEREGFVAASSDHWASGH